MFEVIVKKSKIQGKGVFAGRDFKKGEIVLKWNPTKLKKTQFSEISSQNKKYVSYFKNEAFLMNSPEKFVNHSCNPNTFTKKFCDVAKRQIKKGEEITTNYSKEVKGLDMLCNCGSKNCKKLIKVK